MEQVRIGFKLLSCTQVCLFHLVLRKSQAKRHKMGVEISHEK